MHAKVIIGSLTVLLSLGLGLGNVTASNKHVNSGILETTVTQTTAIRHGKVGSILKKGTLIHIVRKIFAAEGSYWQLTNGNFIPVKQTSFQKVTANYQKYYLHLNRTKIFISKKTSNLYATVNGQNKVGTVKAHHLIHARKIVFTKNGTPKILTTSKHYLTANRNFVKASAGYQNPHRYFQVQNQAIKPAGKVGYSLKVGYEGVKTWLVKRRLKVGNQSNFEFATYDAATLRAVKSFQRSHHLHVNGIVNLATWRRLGFSKRTWRDIDSYAAPLKAHRWNGRQQHIKAEISQAKKYLGKPYIVGASSSPKYGTDCSGLVMQALYAGGLNLNPLSSIHHAYPGNEWNSRNLWATAKLKRVGFAKRQPGDLIFYYAPGTQTIYHVAIYLGHNSIIESWPNHTQIAGIRSNSHTKIAGIKRPFN